MESGNTSSATLSSAAPKRTKICVYCGASTGTKPEHVEAARALARAMAANNIALGEFSLHTRPNKPQQEADTPPLKSTEEAQSG
jgi:hypothetical protein